MKRVVRHLLLLGVFLMLALSLTVTVAQEGEAYSEGFNIHFFETHHNSIDAEIFAIKRVDGDWRESEIHFRFDYAYVDGSRHIDATVVLNGDPDWLEVSEDLGWGGLDGTVWVEQRRRTCDLSLPDGTECGPEVVEMVPVEFHLDLFANASYTENGDYFTRPATVIGTITIDDWVLNLTFGHGLFNTSYNFSDQFPG